MSCAGVPCIYHCTKQVFSANMCLIDDDPKTGVAKCCGFRDEFIVDKARPKEGACCKPNQIYSYDPATSKGSCCAPGQVFKNGECSPKKKPSPNPSPEPSPRCPACTNNYACACDGNLGIQYGHCYTMTDVNGLHLNRDVGGTYQSGGDIDNLIFRVTRKQTPVKLFIRGKTDITNRSANRLMTAMKTRAATSRMTGLGTSKTNLVPVVERERVGSGTGGRISA